MAALSQIFIRASCDSCHAQHSSRRNTLYHLHWVSHCSSILLLARWTQCEVAMLNTEESFSLSNQPYVHWNVRTVDTHISTCFSSIWVPHQGTPWWLQSRWWRLRSARTCRRFRIMFTFQCISDWFDKLNFALMHSMCNIKIEGSCLMGI